MSAVETVVRWFEKSPQGKEFAKAGRAEEALAAERVAAREAWDRAEAEKVQLPALRAAVDAAQVAYDLEVGKRAAVLAAARRAYDEVASSIEHVQSRAANVLRSTAPEALRDRGALAQLLFEKRLHVLRHARPLDLHHAHEFVADHVRLGRPAAGREFFQTEQARVQLAGRAEEILPALDDALERLQDLQLIAAPDVPELLTDLLAELPERCCCGDSFEFHVALNGNRRPR